MVEPDAQDEIAGSDLHVRPHFADQRRVELFHEEEDVFLFQYAANDEYINEAAANLYYRVASGGKSILWYEADHTSVQWKGEADRVAWLLRQLGVGYE